LRVFELHLKYAATIEKKTKRAKFCRKTPNIYQNKLHFLSTIKRFYSRATVMTGAAHRGSKSSCRKVFQLTSAQVSAQSGASWARQKKPACGRIFRLPSMQGVNVGSGASRRENAHKEIRLRDERKWNSCGEEDCEAFLDQT
jgi:hypothetical protein